jgi:hypothetical protein
MSAGNTPPPAALAGVFALPKLDVLILTLMLSLTRHGLNLPDKLLRSYSKSKPTITKKKYSELPALRLLPSDAVLRSQINARLPECVSFATPERLWLSVNMVVCFSQPGFRTRLRLYLSRCHRLTYALGPRL